MPTDPAFPLRHPFSIDGVRIDRLLFRPPAFEDVEAVMRGEITELEMHARMADVPIGVLRALRWVDSEIAFFIARSLAPEFDRR
ncbi:phage tail assembly protein [Aureimonas ureilytica]|uniref:phage tail assembly protein n=1 Tax=Aureimonas ureilytica TaxID=401562 RepID=UPI0012E37A72|nr:phage tail assembly protein [Aureimonas ureilytica]